MYNKYICPDGIEVGIDECLMGCRLDGRINPDTKELYCPAGRCLSLRTLRAIADQREWNGKPSTTQLLNGTRESYLKLTTDYAINPRESLFMLHGTMVHDYLEKYTKGDEISEVRLDDGVSTGAFDFYSPENGGTLYDLKTYGSFKTAKVLGLQEIKIPTGQFFKNGNPKYRKVFIGGGRKDRLDLAIQLNDYRMKIEKELNLPVENLVCEIIVRDGNTYMATQRGVTEPGYLVPINKISDQWVERYMKKKANDLTRALETNTMPPKCSHRECWGGRKCENYCSVADKCKEWEEKHV